MTPFNGAVDIKVKGVGFVGDIDTCPSPGWDWCVCASMMNKKDVEEGDEEARAAAWITAV